MVSNRIAVQAPTDVHVYITRTPGLATHTIVAYWELQLFVHLFEVHITRLLREKYDSKTTWDWAQPESGWRELLPMNGRADLVVHTVDKDRKILIRRIGELQFGITEEETFSLR
jgi:hypothetical protein